MKPAVPAQVRRQGRHLATFALLALISASTLLASPYLQQGFALADLSTASNERRSERLADGSQIDLDASSAVDLQFDPQQRRVNLLRGEVRVMVADDPQRPFSVVTPQGSIRAPGTRLIVERLEDATIVTLLESAARVDIAGHSRTLNAGQRLRFDATGPGVVQAVDSLAVETAWNTHHLAADNQPLSEVLERLARHREGLMWFDKQALSTLQVTAMVPTDDSDRALHQLAGALPIQIRQYSPWLTVVSLKPERADK